MKIPESKISGVCPQMCGLIYDPDFFGHKTNEHISEESDRGTLVPFIEIYYEVHEVLRQVAT